MLTNDNNREGDAAEAWALAGGGAMTRTTTWAVCAALAVTVGACGGNTTTEGAVGGVEEFTPPAFGRDFLRRAPTLTRSPCDPVLELLIPAGTQGARS